MITATFTGGVEMSRSPLPENIVRAVNAIIEPFGVKVRDIVQEQAGQEQPEHPRFLGVREAVRRSGLSRWTLERAAQAGQIKKSKLDQGSRNSKIMYESSSLDSWLDSCCCKPGEAKKWPATFKKPGVSTACDGHDDGE